MIWRRPSRSMRRFSWSCRVAMSYMGSPLLRENQPGKGRRQAYAIFLLHWVLNSARVGLSDRLARSFVFLKPALRRVFYFGVIGSSDWVENAVKAGVNRGDRVSVPQ